MTERVRMVGRAMSRLKKSVGGVAKKAGSKLWHGVSGMFPKRKVGGAHVLRGAASHWL